MFPLRAFSVGFPQYRPSHAPYDGSYDMDCSVLFSTKPLTLPSGFIFLPQSFTLALYWLRALTCADSGEAVFQCPTHHHGYPVSHTRGQFLPPPLGNRYLTALTSSLEFHSFSLKNSNQINVSTFQG